MLGAAQSETALAIFSVVVLVVFAISCICWF